MHPRTIYYLFHTLHIAGFTGTVTAYSPFLRSIGVSLSEIALLNVAFWSVALLSELPTGLFADGRGRGWSVKVGASIHCLGALVYFTAQGFWGALAGEMIVGIGGAFISGALSAWITDALIARGEAGELRRVFATAGILRGAAALGAGMLGALISVWSLRAAWLVDAAFLAAASFIAFRYMRKDGEPKIRIGEWEAFRKSIGLLRSRQALQWGVTASAVFGLIVPFNHYWSLYFREQMGQIGLGFIWILIFVAVTSAGAAVRQSRSPAGSEAGLITAALLAAGAGLLGIGGVAGLVAPIGFMLMHEVGRGAFEPLMESFTQHRVESSYRATYGSLHSLLGRSGFGLTLVGIWLATAGLPDTLPTIRAVFLVCGGLLAACALVLWLIRPQGTE